MTVLRPILPLALLALAATACAPQPRTADPGPSESVAPPSDDALVRAYAVSIVRQVREVWQPDPAAELGIRIAMILRPDGRVEEAEIVEVTGGADEMDRAQAAERALAAVLSFRDRPFDGTPNDRHDLWRYVTLTFRTAPAGDGQG